MALEITTDRRGSALVIAFNRPAAGNALTLDMATQLYTLLKPVTTDRGIRAVMLRGQGGTFMNGVDLGMYKDSPDAGVERANQMIQPYHSAIREIFTMDKPVLAAVEGRAMGPGLSLMLACDLVIAGRGATFGADFTSYGLTPDGGASWHLAHKLGAARAAELLMLGKNFSAEEAAAWGLINRVTDDAKAQEEALAWLDRLANGPTRAYGSVKRLVAKAFDQDLNAQLGLEHILWGAASRSFDFREAMKAFAENRPAKFMGA